MGVDATALAATMRPVETDPVNDIADTSGCVEQRRSDFRAAAHDEVEHTGRQTGVRNDVRQDMGAAGHEIGRLEHDAIAVGERRRDFPGRDRDREIPRRDQRDDADRLARHLDIDPGPHAGDFFARHAQRFAGEERENLPRAHRFADAFRQRLALFACEQMADFLFARQNLVGDLLQGLVALLRRRTRPRGRCRFRRFDRGFGIGFCGARIFTDDVLGVGRIDIGGGAAGFRPMSADEILMDRHAVRPS